METFLELNTFENQKNDFIFHIIDQINISMDLF